MRHAARPVPLRSEQLLAFREAAHAGLALGAAEHLRAHFPEAFQPHTRERVERFVAHGLRRARLHGLRDRGDIVIFLDIMAVLGRRFDEHVETRWVQRYLRDDSRPPGIRVRRLLAAVLARLEAV